MSDAEVVMAHISYAKFRRHLAACMDAVSDSHATLTVTRQKGRSVVVMSEEDYDGLMGTVHLLQSPTNSGRLRAAIAVLDADQKQ